MQERFEQLLKLKQAIYDELINGDGDFDEYQLLSERYSMVSEIIDFMQETNDTVIDQWLDFHNIK